MKYLTLPLHLIKFWYPEALEVFIRSWKNTLAFLEEDLAVGLMWKLLFTPLFHDATIVGRVLSFLFRIIRIFMGLLAYGLASVVILVLAVYWFALPILTILDKPPIISAIILFGGIGLFLIHIFTHPHKKVWQIKEGEDFWEASEIKKAQLDFKKVLSHPAVSIFLSHLELEIKYLPDIEISDWEEIGKRAFNLAKQTGSDYLRTIHFFVSAITNVSHINNILLKYELSLEDFQNCLLYLEKKRQFWRRVYVWDDDFAVHHLKGINRGWLGASTPALDRYSEDLTRVAAQVGFPELVRENQIISEIINILSQESGQNVILIGPAGVGKTSLLHELSRQIVSGDAPPALATKRVVLLDLAKLLSGVKTQGDLAERVKDIFEDVEFSANIILVIEEFHEMGMGEVGGSFNLYSLMQNFLESDTFQFIATTEAENYAKIIERNSSFARIFRKIELPAPSKEYSLKVLQFRAITAEKSGKVKISYLALKEAVELGARLIHDRVLPDSAISVLKEAITYAKEGWVTKDTIRKVVGMRVKVPTTEVGNVDKKMLLGLEKEIHKKFIGQEVAVKVISDSLRRSATGIREQNRPIGSFLFVGPTGVGKTELAKTLAEVYFKDPESFIRFDMSEYQTSEAVSRLLGSEDEGGHLTEAVRRRPYALLLLDEFEKAGEQILTLFLQVLEDGRLTDSLGKVIDFSNTIIIATSNAASLTIARGLEAGKSLDELDKQVNEELLTVFKPELINRFDDVVLFRPLTHEELQKIVQLKLTELQAQLKERGYLVEFDEQLVGELAKKGYDPIMGARPLRRLLQDTLEARLSRMILENKLPKGEVFKAGVVLLVT